MSVKTNGQRAFILVIVGVFFLSSLGVSGLVIWDQLRNNDKKDSTSDIQKQLEELQKKQASANCDGGEPEGVAAKAVPEAFKPAADVTELQTTDLVAGSGEAAKAGDCLVMKYHGTLADGTKFDGNYDKEGAFQFTLGQGRVIEGWDQGLVGMKVGGTRRLVIPSQLAYKEAGAPPTIPANADLVFVVELLSIKKQ